MLEGKLLYVRIDYKIEKTEMSEKDFNDHIDYLSKISKERYFVGGGFTESRGGMIVFEASNKDEAVSICDGDPIISKGFYRYELHPWKIAIESLDS